MPEENEKAAATPAPTMYQLHSVVRSRHNRTQRAALPQKPRRKQYIGADQIRLAHGRPVIITEQQLRKNIADIKAKVAGHVLVVHTMDGRPVDLDTLQPRGDVAPVALQPKFPLDSVENDKNFPGLSVTPPYMGDDLTPPEVLEPGQKPALFEHAETAALDADNQDAPPEAETAEVLAVEEPATEVKESVSSDEAQARRGKKKGR